MADLVIKVKAESDDATKSLTDLGEKLKDVGTKGHESFSLSNIALGSFIGNLAGDAIKQGLNFLADTFKKSIDKASEQEDAIVRLNGALKQAGEFSEATSEKFQIYADKIARVTTLEDDVVLSQIAVAKSFGATDDQAKKIIESAAGLEVRLGRDFKSSVLELSATLEGSSGRLGKVDGNLKNLDETALKAGQGIDSLYKKFGGVGSEGLETFSGTTEQLKKSLGELAESFGGPITKSEFFKEVLRDLTAGVYDFNDLLTKSPTKLEELQNKLKIFETGNTKNNSAASNLRKEIEDEEYNLRYKAAEEAVLKNKQLNDKATEERIKKTQEDNKKESDLLKKNFDEISKNLKNQGATELDTLKNKTEEQRKVLETAHAEGLTSDKEYHKLVLKNQMELNKKLKEEQDKKNKEAAESRLIYIDNENKLKETEKKERDEAFKKVEEQDKKKKESFLELSANPFAKADKNLDATGETTGRAIGVASNVLQGSTGALNLITGAVASFGGPIGAAVAPLIGVLAKGPDAVKSFIKEFIDSVPVLIENIVLAIPAVFEALVGQVPKLVIKLVNAIPTLINALVSQIPTLINSFIESIPQIATALATSFIDRFTKGIPDIIAGIAGGAWDAIVGLFNTLNPFGGDFLGGLFAEGGSYVKQVPGGYPNDSYPARLQSQELVIDRTTGGRLENFLSNYEKGNSNNSSELSNGILLKILDAVSSPMNVESKVTVDKSVFANIMLEINRVGRRVS